MAIATDEIIEVYNAHFRAVFGYCVCRLFRKDLAEDATSEVFVRLVERYPDLKSRSKDQIRYWLYGTASNVVAKHLRDSARQRQIQAALANERVKLSSDVASSELLDWPTLYEAIRRLKEQDQAIVVMRYFHGFGFAEIAKSLDMADVAVRVRLHRSIRTLRKSLGVRV